MRYALITFGLVGLVGCTGTVPDLKKVVTAAATRPTAKPSGPVVTHNGGEDVGGGQRSGNTIRGFVYDQGDPAKPLGNVRVTVGGSSCLTAQPEAGAPTFDFQDGKGPVPVVELALHAGSVKLRQGEFVLEDLPLGAAALTATYLDRRGKGSATVALGENHANVDLGLADATAPTPTPPAASATPTAQPTPTPVGATPTPVPTATPVGATPTPTPVQTATPTPKPSARTHDLHAVTLSPAGGIQTALTIKTDRHCGDPLNQLVYTPADAGVTLTMAAPPGSDGASVQTVEVYYLTPNSNGIPPIPAPISVVQPKVIGPSVGTGDGPSQTFTFSLKTDYLKSVYQNPDDSYLLEAVVAFKDATGTYLTHPNGTKVLVHVPLVKNY